MAGAIMDCESALEDNFTSPDVTLATENHARMVLYTCRPSWEAQTTSEVITHLEDAWVDASFENEAHFINVKPPDQVALDFVTWWSGRWYYTGRIEVTLPPKLHFRVDQEYRPGSPEWRLGAEASLTILSDTEPARVLAKAVGLFPDESWTKGDLMRSGERRRKSGVTYQSGLEETASPGEHLAALVERLRPYVDRIAELSARPTTERVTARVVEHTITDNPELWAEPSDLEVIAAMNARLVVSVWFSGDIAD